MEEMWKRVDLHEISVNDNPPLISKYNKKKNRKQEVTFSLKSFSALKSDAWWKKSTLSLLMVASTHRS